MLCSSIKLTDRKEIKRDSTRQKLNSKTLEQKLFMTSDYCHSYSFRWDKPKLFYNCDSDHYLTVNNIILPDNASAFNTGSSIEKWSKKRPRFKAINIKQCPDSSSVISEDNIDITPLMEEISKETEDTIPSLEANDSESEIDPDIKNLLSIIQDTSNGREDANAWKRQQKKHHHRRKDKGDDGLKEKSKKKAIKFSLSKPPSPQTVQVIRVEVTSSYSLEEPEAIVESERVDVDISDCSKGCGLRIKSANDLKKRLTQMDLEDITENESKDIIIHCNKLALCIRK